MFQPVVSLLTVIQTLTMDKITFNKYMLGIYGVLHFFEQTALLESPPPDLKGRVELC